MDVIRKTAGEIIDELTEKIEMMLEQKQEKLIAAVEVPDTVLQKKKAIPNIYSLFRTALIGCRDIYLQNPGMKWNDG